MMRPGKIQHLPGTSIIPATQPFGTGSEQHDERVALVVAYRAKLGAQGVLSPPGRSVNRPFLSRLAAVQGSVALIIERLILPPLKWSALMYGFRA